ncbi:GntR family transcriptional regulator [Clostridium saccharoperbutylacetonicum]|jgi:GntR family transcriptional regulator of bglA|uniref:GntR family transcriptional regulator n=1 Tax=Clostridium saccharoperbutylacetonicum TaxID=36745 RepID=UPI00098403E8|nr:GntR family transcriptional regulator [Clostridium saccharoperbutylacetonicum]AQR93161.1 putative HTH-type transcriptional regulator YydK [Clostridium saccharoperbutylacetonicum]NSB34578.1 GntR family transcriptional regulator of bglA [Clostridium saccharoperbutylacetonicum]
MKTKYETVINILEREILDGKYSLNKKLPTEEELITRLNVSKNTVRKAIDILVSKGYIYRVQGSGIFLRDFSREGCMDIREMNGLTKSFSKNKLESKVVEFQLIEADEELANKMKCNPNTKIYYVKRVRCLDGVPIVIEESYYNKDIIYYLNEEICSKSIFNYIMDDLKLKIGFADRVISCEKLSEDEAKLLNLNKDEPSLVINNTIFLSNGIIFDISLEKYNYKEVKMISLTNIL